MHGHKASDTGQKIEHLIYQSFELIKAAHSIAVLTGAGISTSAGIPDFRGPQGLYVTRKYDPEKVFDLEHFFYDPQPFYDFARDFVGLEERIKPTLAHHFLAALEKSGKLHGVITQNIDCLHHRAGSKRVFEMHGSSQKSFCTECLKEFTYAEMKTKIFNEPIARCPCGALIKPDVVFFGENVKHLNESFQLAEAADLFIVVGSSCVVYPAGFIPEHTRGKIIVVNLEPVHFRSVDVTVSIQHDIDQFFGKLAHELKLQLPLK